MQLGQSVGFQEGDTAGGCVRARRDVGAVCLLGRPVTAYTRTRLGSVEFGMKFANVLHRPEELPVFYKHPLRFSVSVLIFVNPSDNRRHHITETR
jgi:hypothetical protein